MNKKLYAPQPINTFDILPKDLNPLEARPKNVHEIWAQESIVRSRSYGGMRNDVLSTTHASSLTKIFLKKRKYLIEILLLKHRS